MLVLKYLKSNPKILEETCRFSRMENSVFLQTLARNVAMLRTQRGWSQDELGRRAGLSQKVISNLENAVDRDISPTMGTVVAVADALKTSLLSLLVDMDARQVSSVKSDKEIEEISYFFNSYVSLPKKLRQTVDRVLELEIKASPARNVAEQPSRAA